MKNINKNLRYLALTGLLIASVVIIVVIISGWQESPSYFRECEDVDDYTVGDPNNIYRSDASKKRVLGQFGCEGKSWSPKSGYAKYDDIHISETGNWTINIRYSYNNDHSIRIRIYLDNESEPRAIFYPKNTHDWNNFQENGKIKLGAITAGYHSITFKTEGTKYCVADLDYFVLSIQSNGPPWLVIALILFVILIVVVLIMYKQKPEKSDSEESGEGKIEEKEKSIENLPPDKRYTLDENEMNIVNLLSKKDGTIQEDIGKRIGLDKRRVSDYMRNVEYRDMIRRVEDGQRKRVFLKEWVKDLLRESERCEEYKEKCERWLSIVLALREEGNLILQELFEKTKIPKSTISTRILQDLEKRDIIIKRKDKTYELLKYQKNQ